MPTKPGRPCRVRGCPEVVASGGYCPAHQAERVAEYDRARGSSSARGYGTRWQKIRAQHLAAHPFCADPFGDHRAAGVQAVAATEVDHITPRRGGGSDDPSNLQSLCKSCHSKKTATEDGRWGMGG